MHVRDIEQESLDIQYLRRSVRLSQSISSVAFIGTGTLGLGSIMEYVSHRPVEGAVPAAGSVVMGVIGTRQGMDAIDDAVEIERISARHKLDNSSNL